MDFTREPVIETVITPKEGCKLVIRSSKATGQEEYFVDSCEVVTFGSSIFFRSLERPKPFMVPASDYEVLEVREARIVLKNVGVERNIKIGGGREQPVKAPREPQEEKVHAPVEDAAAPSDSNGQEGRGVDRKKDRRRQSRRRRDRVEGPVTQDESPAAPKADSDDKASVPAPVSPPRFLAPPPLISETISRYKEQFKDAFYSREEKDPAFSSEALPGEPIVAAEPPVFGTFDVSEAAEEEIYSGGRQHYFPEGDAPETTSPVEEKSEEQNENPT